MNDSRLLLYRVPAADWGDVGGVIAPFVRDALVIEGRMAKGVRLDKERTRYRLCCIRIQEGVRRRSAEYETRTLEAKYLDLLTILSQIWPAEIRQGRLAACFFPPNGEEGQWVAAQIDLMTRLGTEPVAAGGLEVLNKRRSFFQEAQRAGDGVVEILDLAWDGRPASAPHPLPAADQLAHGAADSLTAENRQGLEALLISRMETAMASGTTVNVSSQPHFVLSEVLHRFVYKSEPAQAESQVRIVYLDGSAPSPFPVRILTPAGEGNGTDLPVVRAALVSMRHLALDEQVDLAWFRNSKVSVPQPGAVIEAYCADETRHLLAAHRHLPLEIHLYQTGLETAVMGFYRGLAAELATRRSLAGSAPLRVVPFYYLGPDKGLRQGTVWS